MRGEEILEEGGVVRRQRRPIGRRGHVTCGNQWEGAPQAWVEKKRGMGGGDVWGSLSEGGGRGEIPLFAPALTTIGENGRGAKFWGRIMDHSLVVEVAVVPDGEDPNVWQATRRNQHATGESSISPMMWRSRSKCTHIYHLFPIIFYQIFYRPMG